MNIAQTKVILLYSDPNFFSIELLNNLISDNFLIKVVTNSPKIWKEKTKLFDPRKFVITSSSNYLNVKGFNYAIFCGGLLKKEDTFKDFKKFLINKNFKEVKTLAIFPFEVSPYINKNKISLSQKAGIIYLGDMLGASIDLNSNLLLPVLIKRMIDKRSLVLSVGEIFYPLWHKDAARTVAELLEQKETYGKITFLSGTPILSNQFWKQHVKFFPGLKVSYDTGKLVRNLPVYSKLKKINSDFATLLSLTYKPLIHQKNLQKDASVTRPRPRLAEIIKHTRIFSFSPKTKEVLSIKSNLSTVPNVVQKIKASTSTKSQELKRTSSKTANTKIKWGKVKYLIFVLVFILSLPILTVIASTVVLFFSFKLLNTNNYLYSANTFKIAKSLYIFSKKESDLWDNIPILQNVYKEIYYISYMGENTSDIFINALPILTNTKIIINNVFSSDVLDINKPAEQITASLAYISRQLALLETTTQNDILENVWSAKKINSLIDFDKYKRLTSEVTNLSTSLPNILGVGEAKNYLILFQNNMELRPTGGFIGSYGIANFGGGKLNGLTINDVYSADGQLKGHVEPPAPIKNYLGEANWWFRDSNWDPDFTVSAQRAEWFLGKEMDQSVDGVIGVDLTLIKNILEFTGPIFLPDYNLSISASNLYEKTQEETEKDFFPGSRRKASFLTALSRVLLDKVSKMDKKQILEVIKSFYDGLEEKDVQLYFHNDSVQDSFDMLNWTGKNYNYSCGETCYPDFFGEVEANLGVNKANYFIQRNLNFSSVILPNKIQHVLSVQLENRAGQSLGPSGNYQVYIRALIPKTSEIQGVKVVKDSTEQRIPYDILDSENAREVGVYVEVNAGKAAKIVFNWNASIPSNKKLENYSLLTKKQAGTGNDPITLNIKSNIHVLSTKPAFSLTEPNIYTYNTTLEKDFLTNLSFK